MEEDNPAEELAFFLSTDSPAGEIKLRASEYLLGLTGSEEGREFIITHIGSRLMKLLEDLVDDECYELRTKAHKSLINLCADKTASELIISENLLNSLFQAIISSSADDSKVNAESASMSLSNLAHWEFGAIKIMRFLQKEDKTMILYQLIDKFFMNIDSLHHLASLFSNLSQVKEARNLFLDKEKLVFQRLLSFISFKGSKIRQHGVAATVKNCCFEVDDHLWLLGEKVDILPRLLLPLAGPEVFDDEDNEKLPVDLQYLEDTKERESDPSIRKILIEALCQLCTTQAGRKIVKDANSYVILRELHKWETDETCIAAIENLISLLISDEPEKGLEDLHKVIIPEDVQKRLT